MNKSNLLSYDGLEPSRVRDNSDEYLPDDVSIMIAVRKQANDNSIFVDLVGLTNINLFVPRRGDVLNEIIMLLDPTIEYITTENVNDKIITRLKFIDQDERVLSDPREINVYLSSGTVKGVRVFTDAIRVLKKGGYLLIDEVENHFNRELVTSLIRLFLNKKTDDTHVTSF